VGAEFFHAKRRTDGHDETNSHFSQFCEGAKKNITSHPFLIRNSTETRDPSHEHVCHVVSIMTFGLH